MKRFEFISLKEFPEGKYPTAIATIRVNTKDEFGNPVREVLRYARKETKSGGQFWAMATHSVEVGGEKRYIPGYKMDSDMDEEMLIDFLKESVKNLQAPKVQMTASVAQGSVNYPYSASMPDFPANEQNQEQLPF